MNLQTSIALEAYNTEKDLIDLKIYKRLKMGYSIVALLHLQNNLSQEIATLLCNDVVEDMKCTNLKNVTPLENDTRTIQAK